MLLVYPNMKWMYAVKADKFILRISEAPVVNTVYWRSHFANTQFEAVRYRIGRCSGIPAPNIYRSQRRM